jgi:hypothetical protein
VQRRGPLSSADAVAAGAGDGTQPEPDADTVAEPGDQGEAVAGGGVQPEADAEHVERAEPAEPEAEANEAGAEAPSV